MGATSNQVTLGIPEPLWEELSNDAMFMDISVEELVIRRLERAGKPTEREIAAVTVLRQKALDMAVSIAEPGTSAHSVGYEADQLLTIMLGK